MLDQSKYTAQDALELIEADTPPLAFGTGIAVYRAAVKKLAKLEVPGLMTHDLSSIPMTLGFVDQLFEIPAALDELQRQAIQQLGIKRFLALAAEVLRRLHQTATEQALPDAVHRDPRQQRMVRCGEPARKAKAIRRLSLW